MENEVCHSHRIFLDPHLVRTEFCQRPYAVNVFLLGTMLCPALIIGDNQPGDFPFSDLFENPDFPMDPPLVKTVKNHCRLQRYDIDIDSRHYHICNFMLHTYFSAFGFFLDFYLIVIIFYRFTVNIYFMPLQTNRNQTVVCTLAI